MNRAVNGSVGRARRHPYGGSPYGSFLGEGNLLSLIACHASDQALTAIGAVF